jgi:uncharacterized protein (DUF58 family)
MRSLDQGQPRPDTAADTLLPSTLLRKLERLSLLSTRPMRGQVLGARKSVKHGASVEFSDFRDYTRGDDLRYVDWKAYGRLEKLFVKLFREEDDLSLHLLLDASVSMDFGAPVSKLRFGQELCAAMGAIALMEFDRCSLTTLSGGAGSRAPVVRGRRAVGELLRRIAVLRSHGQASIAQGVMRTVQAGIAPGVLAIISDFYEHGLTKALLARVSRQLDIVLIHVVTRSEVDPEIDPELAGDLRLIDPESNSFVELTVTPATIAEYKARFLRYCGEIEDMARSVGAGYLRVTADSSVEEIVLGAIRRKRIVG